MLPSPFSAVSKKFSSLGQQDFFSILAGASFPDKDRSKFSLRKEGFLFSLLALMERLFSPR